MNLYHPNCTTCRFHGALINSSHPNECFRFPAHPTHGRPEASEQHWCGEYQKSPPVEGGKKPTKARLVAFVSEYTLRDTIQLLNRRNDIQELRYENARGTLKDGSPFVTIHRVNDVMGLEFSRYETLGNPSEALILAVATRLRPEPLGQDGDGGSA